MLQKKTELLKTSAQDQFAKWAKLRRSVDKGLADLEKLSAYLAFHSLAILLAHIRLPFSCALAPLQNRRGFVLKSLSILSQIQVSYLAADDGPQVLHWLVVPQAACVLSPAQVARPSYIVDGTPLRAERYASLLMRCPDFD